ncbi:MAG: hypothetical protein AAFZ15_17255 [Bacteroidota bacterium]
MKNKISPLKIKEIKELLNEAERIKIFNEIRLIVKDKENFKYLLDIENVYYNLVEEDNKGTVTTEVAQSTETLINEHLLKLLDVMEKGKPTLSNEAIQILQATINDRDGLLMLTKSSEGSWWQTGQVVLFRYGNITELVFWEEALETLCELGLMRLNAVLDSNTNYKITAAGVKYIQALDKRL